LREDSPGTVPCPTQSLPLNCIKAGACLHPFQQDAAICRAKPLKKLYDQIAGDDAPFRRSPLCGFGRGGIRLDLDLLTRDAPPVICDGSGSDRPGERLKVIDRGTPVETLDNLVENHPDKMVHRHQAMALALDHPANRMARSLTQQRGPLIFEMPIKGIPIGTGDGNPFGFCHQPLRC
jgi:hypothetical protein